MRRKRAGVWPGFTVIAGGLLSALLLSGCARTAQDEPPTATSVPPTVRPTATERRPPVIAQNATPTPIAPSLTTEVPPTVTETPEPPPTDTPVPTETDTPSPTAEPSPTPGPSATPTIEAVGTDWLQYLNLFRREAGLPLLLEDTLLSQDAAAHSRYMTYTGELLHSENSASPYFSRAGQSAAENGNIAAGTLSAAPFKWAFNYWMSAPFHATPILDPQLGTTGFAEYRDVGGVQPVTATMDVRRGLGATPGEVTFPVMYPRDGGLTWVLRYSLPEFPEALSTCPGYVQPTGAPIILQIGDGSQVPSVTATALYKDGEYLPHCRFDETTFTHPDAYRQRTARLILDQRDAIVIIPQQPLLPDSTYAVRVDVNGQTYTWSFRTAAAPPG